MNIKLLCSLFCCFCLLSCKAQTAQQSSVLAGATSADDRLIAYADTNAKSIHVFVALCDNKYQGIVPVPAKIGNGQDPFNNLYWGCAYGVKSFFKNSADWQLISASSKDSIVLERLIFKHKTKNWFLIADAYNGKDIKTCTRDFLKSSAGLLKDTLHFKDRILGTNGNAKLLAYIGHDGLMDFDIDDSFHNIDSMQRDVIILACYSKRFFSSHLQSAKVNPLLWSSGLMSPEAYTLYDALKGYLMGETNEQIRDRAATAYAKYQKCSLKAAKNLLLSDW